MEIHPHQLNLISDRDLVAEYEYAMQIKDAQLAEQLRKEIDRRRLKAPDRRQP
jgi:hypothetical protein